MADRFTMCNMAIEAGAKAGIVEPDATTEDYVKERAKREYIFFNSDKDCVYTQVLEIETSGLEPQVASPPLPSNSIPVGEVTDIRIDQAVIGSCTNGRIEDLRLAASILSGRKVHKDVRLLVIPATQQVYKQAIKEGLIEVFLDAGGCVSTPTCGPCLGGHLGVLADGERAISTTNRNFVGRMGHPCSEIYLSNPAVAAASAVVGKIVHPEEV
jgi:3-isopropylmalate/(R)-2-methylmalate dehydratase large subunit